MHVEIKSGGNIMEKRSVPFSVYLTSTEKKRFEEFAREQGRSLASQFRISLERDIKRSSGK